ncbi:hypothetical protein A3J11_01205 [Candidatus Kaiserbacteria bacterium RIFCSPLOWO2_02_FULL_55_12]|uniref:Uncharacterized protein n=1 Tax=Candidatus Kaiserbacteria bacterium RIFCSPLOWO2_02_FULL_55_12 TaxID=1798522 RepID=A0A1F6F2I0_9BACT|nr:MAG: hypothetical protein A3J11_01205 [Candidatus Kaiserbacteria bacterium RIFCSPLOWO2_02_FULL_55_12]
MFALSVCIAVIAGFGFWYATLKDKSVAVADLERQIAAKTETTGRIASARASLAEIAGDEASIRGYFVPEAGVVSFITDLESRGRAQGAVVSVRAVSTSGTGVEQALAFSLVVEGTFDAVMRTVGAIEYAPYALSVSALSLGRDDADRWHADLGLLVGSVSASVVMKQP